MAKSQYATVKQKEGVCYLSMKTAEIAAFPAKLLEKVKRNRNFEKAMQRELGSTSKCKQRLVKIPRYLIRMRKLKLKMQKKIVLLQRQIGRREDKPLIAARLDNHIEKELLQRCNGHIYNLCRKAFEQALETEEVDGEEDEVEKETEEETEEELDTE